MDKVINSHVDKIEELQDEFAKIIDSEIDKIDIDALLDNAEQELEVVINNIKQAFLDKYASKALEYGIDFGKLINKKIEQDKTIKVDKSKDANLNA